MDDKEVITPSKLEVNNYFVVVKVNTCIVMICWWEGLSLNSFNTTDCKMFLKGEGGWRGGYTPPLGAKLIAIGRGSVKSVGRHVYAVLRRCPCKCQMVRWFMINNRSNHLDASILLISRGWTAFSRYIQ